MLLIYRKTSSIRDTKYSNLNVSHLALQLLFPNPLKPGVKSKMKMQLERRRQATQDTIGSDNGLWPVRGQAVVPTNTGILSIELLETHLSEILIEIFIQEIAFENVVVKLRPFCLGLNMLIPSISISSKCVCMTVSGGVYINRVIWNAYLAGLSQCQLRLCLLEARGRGVSLNFTSATHGCS